MKFKNYIETESGIKDTSTSPGTSGQVLSSTVTGTSWITLASGNVSGTGTTNNMTKWSNTTGGLADALMTDNGSTVTLSTNGSANAFNLSHTSGSGIALNITKGGSGEALVLNKTSGSGNVLSVTGDSYFNGDVGIGTDSPTEKLEVEDSGTLGVNKDVLSITNKVPSSPSVDTTVGMNFNLQQSSNSAITYGAIQVGEHAGTGSIKGSMRFLVQDFSGGFNLDEKMRVESNGNVGIGTNNPESLLHLYKNNTSTSKSLMIDQDGSGDATMSFRLTGVQEYAFGIDNSDGNKLKIANNGTVGTNDLLVIQTNGNVGIGTINPDYKLEVNGSIASSVTSGFPELRLSDAVSDFLLSTNSGGDGIIKTEGTSKNIRFFNNSGETMRISGNGNVGINSTNPYAKLHVASTSSNNVPTAGTATGGLWVSTSNQTFGINMGVSVSGWGFIQSQRADTGTALYNLNLQPLGGNVGIGTDSPNAKLEVAGYTRITGGGLDVGYGNNGTNYVQVGFGRTTNGYALIDLIGDSTYTDYGFRILRNNSGPNTDTDILHRGTGDLDLKTVDAGDIGFHTTSVQRMIVKSSGNVGIGDTNPDAKLEIAGHSTSGKFLLIDAVAPGDTFLDVEDGQNATLFSITRETGNTIKFNSFNDFSFADNISVTGTVTATNFILSSDETLKDNIKEIDVKHTDVNWKNFELKSEPGIKRAGVIAQELEVKHPEFVRTASDGIKSVAYIDLLITKIAELEARLEKAGL